MSSYNQVPMTTTIGEAVTDAGQEFAALRDEMAELCASIAAQFAETYEKIPKYQEALCAHDAMREAATTIEQALDLDHDLKDAPLRVKIGKQTRRNRPTSQRVRLGNAVVRLAAAAIAMREYLSPENAEVLEEIIETVNGITFPKTYG